jgi:hypothetical protein
VLVFLDTTAALESATALHPTLEIPHKAKLKISDVKRKCLVIKSPCDLNLLLNTYYFSYIALFFKNAQCARSEKMQGFLW